MIMKLLIILTVRWTEEGSPCPVLFGEKRTGQRMYSQRAISFSVAKSRYEYVFLLGDGSVIQRVRLE